MTSEQGKGSTFSICIPASPPENGNILEDKTQGELSQENSFSADIPQSICNALVVEDNRTNLLLITLLLQKLGVKAVPVDNAPEAIQRASQENFDMIFMDIQMPQIDGYEATKKLRTQGITTPIIAITAHAMQADREKCFEAGCNDYVSKPISRVKLQQIISKYVPAVKNAAENHMESFSS